MARKNKNVTRDPRAVPQNLLKPKRVKGKSKQPRGHLPALPRHEREAEAMERAFFRTSHN